MSATLFSLIAVTVGFVALVLWVYWPSRRSRIEALGQIPFDSEETGSAGKTEEQTERRQ